MLISDRHWQIGDRLRATIVGTVIDVAPGDNIPVKITPVRSLNECCEAVGISRFFDSEFLGPTVKVGYKVRRPSGTVATVLGIDGKQAWIRSGPVDFRSYDICPLSGLVPIPADSE